jgi:hypothetical protein
MALFRQVELSKLAAAEQINLNANPKVTGTLSNDPAGFPCGMTKLSNLVPVHKESMDARIRSSNTSHCAIYTLHLLRSTH